MRLGIAYKYQTSNRRNIGTLTEGLKTAVGCLLQRPLSETSTDLVNIFVSDHFDNHKH